MHILMGLIAIAVVIGGCYLVYTRLMVPNGDGNMPSDLVNQVKSDVTDIAPKL